MAQAELTSKQSKPAEQTPTPGRLKLKTWRGMTPISESTSQFTVVLGGYIDMGGDGKCEVTSLEIEPATGLIYFTVKSVNGASAPRRLVLQGEGAGELCD